MVILLTIIHVLMCFAIIAIVLLQSGKGADIGSAFGGAGSQAVFGSMGTPTLLGKVTTAVAIVFTITSFSLALLGGERSSSVVREPTTPGPRRRVRRLRPAPRPPRPRRPHPRRPPHVVRRRSLAELGALLALVGLIAGCSGEAAVNERKAGRRTRPPTATPSSRRPSGTSPA